MTTLVWSLSVRGGHGHYPFSVGYQSHPRYYFGMPLGSPSSNAIRNATKTSEKVRAMTDWSAVCQCKIW